MMVSICANDDRLWLIGTEFKRTNNDIALHKKQNTAENELDVSKGKVDSGYSIIPHGGKCADINSNVGPPLPIILCVRDCRCMCDTLLSHVIFLYLHLWRYIVEAYRQYTHEQCRFHFCFPHTTLAWFGPSEGMLPFE